MNDDNEVPTDEQSTPSNADLAWGVDRKDEDRPGVPKETHGVQPFSTTAKGFASIQQQSDEPKPFVGPNRFLTPVYSTALPPRGLSGLIRKAAYRVPEYKARRWMMLLAADRIDVLEHANIGRAVVGAGLIVIGFSVMKALRA